MSLKTWKEEYYKVEAKDVPVADALDHSILKWTGLLRENLERHLLTAIGSGIEEFDDGYLFLGIDDESCALCVHFNDGAGCANCPIVRLRGARCDDRIKDEKPSPYQSFVFWGNAKPMLELLLETKRTKEKDAL